MAKSFFGGMVGNAETELKTRKDRLQEAEDKATNTQDTSRQKKNEDAANGKIRLTTQDKKY